MDDDLRNRFRSSRRSYDRPTHSKPSESSRPVPVTPPKPVNKPTVASQQPQLEPDWEHIDNSEPFIQNKQKPKKLKNPKKPRKKRKIFKRLFITTLVLLLLSAAAYGAFKAYKKYWDKPKVVSQETTTQPEVVSKPTGTIRMFATGDNLAFDSINTAAKTASGYDYLPMMSNFKPIFDKADIRLCNETTPGGGEALGVSGFPTFNSPTAWSTGFANLGCNLINLGSDHTNDVGQTGIDNMVNTWKARKDILAFAGANSSAQEQSQIRYFSVKQVKIAYLSYTTRTVKTDNTPYGINIYSSALANKQIVEAAKNASLIFVSITWGNEDQSAITGDQNRIAKELAEYGADVVIGGGPHVLQSAQILDGIAGHQTLVWFSLGNFLNSQLPINNLIGGMAVMDFDVASGQLRDPKLLPVYMHYDWTASQKAAGLVSSRTNFKLYPLDQAGEALAKSQNGTTIAEQTSHVTDVITKLAPIKVITSKDL